MDARRMGGETKTCWQPKEKHLPIGKPWLRLANVCPADECLPWKVFLVWFLTWPVLPVHSLHGMFVFFCICVSVHPYMFWCVYICICCCCCCMCSYACLYVFVCDYICLPVYQCVCLCVTCLCLCIFLSLHLYMYIRLFLSVSVHLCVSVFKCVYVSRVYVYMCIYLCLSMWMLTHTGWWERRGRKLSFPFLHILWACFGIFATLLWLLEGGCGISWNECRKHLVSC